MFERLDGAVHSMNAAHSDALAEIALLDEQRVAVTPGEAFDSPGFIRMSYATSMDNLKEGSRRLVEFVQAHAGTPAAAGR